MFKKDYAAGISLTGGSLDDPDQNFHQNHACLPLRNDTNDCNPALEKEFDLQSMETGVARRKAIVWDIEPKLTGDVVRPIIYHAAACWYHYTKNMTIMAGAGRMSGWINKASPPPKTRPRKQKISSGQHSSVCRSLLQ